MRVNGVMEFFAMGGYAAFVWPALGLVLVVLVALLVASLRQMRVAEADLAALETRKPRRRST